MRKITLLVLFAVACRPAPSPAPATPADVTRPPTRWPHEGASAPAFGTRGMVASDAPLASEAGVEIMKAGGNAVDAAVAVGFALAVVYPEAGNLGGGGFTVVRMADGRSGAVDYREMAPLAATRDMYLDDSGSVTRASVEGPLASGVPGSVAGMVATHERFGSLSLARVMEPAIRLAEQGFSVDSQLARSLRNHRELIDRFGGGPVFLPGGEPLPYGSTLRQPALARTLRAIADSGAVAFYAGSIATVMADDLRAAGSIITAEDLRRYKAEWREPIRATYRGHTLMTMPPPSSGVTMVEALNILEGFEPLPAFGSARHAHLVASALQRAFIDRNSLLGDPAFTTVPIERLTSKSYAARLRAGIRGQATPTAGLVTDLQEGMHTTHYAVIDAAGNAVSTTTTINDLYGSGVYLPNVGIFMNDEMDDFAASPGKPNAFGLVQGEQNAIQPGKRMLSSMLPTIVIDRAGQPLLLVGARGGPRIVSSTMQTIINVLDYGMSLVDAVNAPRVHHQALPDTLRYERDGLRPSLLDSLGALGYVSDSLATGPAVAPTRSIGSVNAILRTREGWVGYSDPRAGGRAVGY